MQAQNSIVPEKDTQDPLPPLQPLSFTEILDGMFSLYRKHFRLFFMIATVFFVISYGFNVIKNGVSVTLENGDPSSQDFLNSVFMALLGLFITGALLYATAQVFLGKNTSPTAAMQQSLRRYLFLFGGFFIYLLVCALPIIIGVSFGIPFIVLGNLFGIFLLFIGIPFGIYFLVRWCFYPLPILLEESSVMISLRRSSQLVKGNWWRVFGITLAIFLIYSIIYIILLISVSIIFFLIPGTDAFFDTASTLDTILFLTEPTPHEIGWGIYLFWLLFTSGIHSLTMPIVSIGYTLLYFDMRIRKEAYDLEMQATTPVDQMQNPQ